MKPIAPLRAVEAFPIEYQGQTMILIRDPEHLSPEGVVVPPPLFMIMTLFDGRRDAAAVGAALRQVLPGAVVGADQIESIARQLDELYLLDTERAAARRRAMVEEFTVRLTRPAAHAGSAYPEDAEACRAMFAELFDGVERPAGDACRPRGLIVPHIDLRVGGACLARTLAMLPPDRLPSLYIVLGVAHQGGGHLAALTEKSFETPLGLMPTARPVVRRLSERYGAGRLGGEYLHRFEHSVEFPAVALRYLHGDSDHAAIVPILCGALPEVDGGRRGGSPMERPEVREFVQLLREVVQEHGDDVCVIASVDLSHVGRKFGDAQGITPERAALVEQADRAMLALVAAGDAEAFLDHFRVDGNARHVDAVTAVYVMMQVLGPRPTRLIEYRQWHEAATDSMVTFAGVVLY